MRRDRESEAEGEAMSDLLGMPESEPILSLEDSIDAFSETANRIADQLIEERDRSSRPIHALRQMRRIEQRRPGDLRLLRMIDAALNEAEEGA